MQWLDRTYIAQQSDGNRKICFPRLQWLDRTDIAEQRDEYRGICFLFMQRLVEDNIVG